MALYHQLQNIVRNGQPLSELIISYVVHRGFEGDTQDDITQTILLAWLSHPGTKSECKFYLKRVGLEVADGAIERFLEVRMRQKRIVEDMIIEDRLARGDSRYILTHSQPFKRRSCRRVYY